MALHVSAFRFLTTLVPYRTEKQEFFASSCIFFFYVSDAETHSIVGGCENSDLFQNLKLFACQVVFIIRFSDFFK